MTHFPQNIIILVYLLYKRIWYFGRIFCLLIRESYYGQIFCYGNPILIFPSSVQYSKSTNGHVIASIHNLSLSNPTMCFANVMTGGNSVVMQCGYYKHEVLARFRCYAAKHIPFS